MSEIQQKLVAMVDKMPAFSSSVTKILQLTSDINCAPKELVQVIDHDPVMTIKILKLVNSAYFGLPQKIVSIKHGIVYVGINTIKNLALTIAAMGMLPKKTASGFNMSEFLLHSLGTATLAKLLSQRLGVPSRESADYFVAGLLHDFGKVVFAQFMPVEMEQALQRAASDGTSLYVAERLEIGADHSEVGGMLGEKWQLPQELVTSIKEHHEPSSEANEATQMRDCVLAANLLIKQLAFGNAGNPIVEPLPPPVMEQFGLDLDGLRESLGDISEELEKARVFAHL